MLAYGGVLSSVDGQFVLTLSCFSAILVAISAPLVVFVCMKEYLLLLLRSVFFSRRKRV